MTRFAILDCDGGSDDAWALLLLLQAKKDFDLELLAITITGGGNTTLEHAARNMYRILAACDRLEVPIFLGAADALINTADQEPKLYFHGRDGFGDILDVDELPPIEQLVQPKHAVTAIWDLCREHSKQVTIFIIGPLTNVALGYSMYGAEFGAHVKDIYIMGGNHQGVGNTTRSAEFNFYSDPEAAHVVLEKAHCPITILPWETCINERFSLNLSWRLDDFGQRLAVTQHKAIELLNRVESAQYIAFGFPTWNPCDALLIVVYLFEKHFVQKQSHWHATVDLQGRYTRGQMVLDHLRDTTKYPENVRIIEHVDVEFFKKVVEWVAGLQQDFVAKFIK